MNLYVLEIIPVEKKFNIPKFMITLEGENELSREGDWVGSNGSLFYLDQMNGYWQAEYSNGKLNLYIFDGREKDRFDVSLRNFSFKINTNLSNHVLAVLDVNNKWLPNLGTKGNGYMPRIYKNYNFSFRVTERNF